MGVDARFNGLDVWEGREEETGNGNLHFQEFACEREDREHGSEWRCGVMKVFFFLIG